MANELLQKIGPTYILTSRDLCLASTFKTMGVEPRLARSTDGPIDFFFESSTVNLAEVQERFYSRDLKVEPRTFTQCWRELRKQMDSL